MNPFVNPKKRSVSLPRGCKDLLDVLQLPERIQNDAIRRFIHLLLFQAQQDAATELVIGVTPEGKDTPIRYKAEGVCYDMSFPSHIRVGVVAELARLAKLPVGQFPSQGVLDVALKGVHLKWTVGMKSADGDCILVRVND